MNMGLMLERDEIKISVYECSRFLFEQSVVRFIESANDRLIVAKLKH